MVTLVSGVLVTNVSARNESMKTHVLQALRQVYSTVLNLPLQEDLNDIAIGLKEGGILSSSGAGGRDGCQEGNMCSTVKCDNENGKVTSSVASSLVADERLFKGEVASQQCSFTADSIGNGSEWWNGDGMERGVHDLVSVIGENGGDVEGLESELTGFLRSKSIFAP